jgi:type II secretory pathway component GspD/PulD (secretin)
MACDMHMNRGMIARVLVIGWIGLALAQTVPSEGRRGRSPRLAADRPAEVSDEGQTAELPPPVSLSSADAVDYTRLLEKFLSASVETPDIYFYRCKYVSGETMRRLLENFLTPAGTVGRSDEDDVVVVSDVPDRMPQLKQILDQADQPVAQVLVEARIVELEISNDLTRDINMGFAKTDASDSVRKVFQDLILPGSSSDGADKEDLSSTYSAGKGSDGHLWTFIGLDQVKIWAMINFLQEKGRARILSSPNLVIRRGSDGSIMTGEKIPVLSRTITGSSESISTTFEKVGVTLMVRPVMISGKRINVKVNPEVSSAPRTVDTGGFETPVIVVRSASTQLEANDGELITIGGLMRQEQRLVERRIPYLADIPYLGVLFQYKKSSAFTSQIVIFMTMRLVEPGASYSPSMQTTNGLPSDIYERVQAIEEDVQRENEAIWKEVR